MAASITMPHRTISLVILCQILYHAINFDPVIDALSAPIVPRPVLSALNHCYPPKCYDERRQTAYDAALSTTVEFTPEGIPLGGDTMTYGEFDLNFFARLLRLADPKPGDVFVGVGSGAGRLVLASALLHPKTWSNCHGVELSSPLHNMAISARHSFETFEINRKNGSSSSSQNEKDETSPTTNNKKLMIAPCQYTLSNCMEQEEGLQALREANVVFSYAVTWAHGETHNQLVRTLAQCLPDGARIISIDLPLRNDLVTSVQFELLASEVGYNEETGDETKGLVYKLVKI